MRSRQPARAQGVNNLKMDLAFHEKTTQLPSLPSDDCAFTMPPPLREPLLLQQEIEKPAAEKSDVLPILLMISSELLLATCNSIVKLTGGWPSERIMLIRFFVDFCLCAIACAVLGLRPPSSAVDLATLTGRGIAYCTGITFFWAALRSCLPIGNTVVLVIASSPLVLVLSTRLILGEAIPKLWPLQMCLLVLGATLIEKPGAPSADCPFSTALLPVGAAASWACMNFASRRVPHLSPLQVMLVNDGVAMVFACATALVTHGADSTAALEDLRPPLDRDLVLIVASAAFGWLGLMGNIRGYQTASTAAVATVAGATSIPFNYAYQVFLFRQPLDALSLVGALIVCATTVGMTVAKHLAAKREQAHKQQQEEVVVA